MKKIMLCLLLALTTAGFAESLVLENQTAYPLKNQKSKIAIQWASSAREVEDQNQAVTHGSELKSSSVQTLNQAGKVKLSIPAKAEYFRVLAWSKGEGKPDLLTNWVEIVPNKTYTLKADHLVPVVLMSGTGC